MLRCVIDTKVLLVGVSDRSPLHWLFRRFRAGAFGWCVTTEILAEYAQIVERHMGLTRSLDALDALPSQPNLVEVNPTYRFNLLADPDDHKVVERAIAANAGCLVSRDRGFLPLRAIEFPKVAVVDTVEFRELLTT